MTEEQEQQLLANVKSLTDRLTIVDEILAAAKLGEEMVMVFQCGESGLYYPGDYVRNWGKLYGIGLGPHPVSESLQSEYDIDPPEITREIRSLSQIMHPMRVSCAQMDMDLVAKEIFDDSYAILAIDDPYYTERAAILRAKQLINPAGRLHIAEAAWNKKRERMA